MEVGRKLAAVWVLVTACAAEPPPVSPASPTSPTSPASPASPSATPLPAPPGASGVVREAPQAGPLSFTVRCRREPCRADDQDMFFDITVTNTGPTVVGFPREFLQKRGPSVRLVDAKTKAETFLRTNPVDLSLADRFTQLAPGASTVVQWLIHPSELRQFGPEVDVSAEVMVDVTIEALGKREPFARKAVLHVTR